MRTLINFILFQVAWFACVLGAAHGVPWAGPLVVLGVVLHHLATARDVRAEWLLLAVALAVGAVFDSALASTGWISFTAGQWHPGLAPYWMMTMWMAFATTLNVSLGWLKPRPVLAALFGAVGDPLAYLAGAGLGAATLVDQTAAVAALAVGWSLVTPGLTTLAARLDAWPTRRPTAAVTE